MSSEGHVLLLRCGNCGNELSGLSTDTIFLCTGCGRAWVCDESLSEVEVLVGRDLTGGAVHMPFWEIRADVRVRERIGRMQSWRSPLEGPRYFARHGERGLRTTWKDAEGKALVLPAFTTTRTLTVGVGLNGKPPVPEPVDDMEFPACVGGSTTISDAIGLARGVAVGIEVAADDYLAMVDIDFTPYSCRLLVLPCYQVRSALTVADTGVVMPCGTVEDWDAILAWHGASS
jgi:hypothetical protein